MKTMRTIIILLIVIVIIAAIVIFWSHASVTAPTTIPVQPIASFMYQCDGGKTIAAQYYNGTSTPSTSSTTPPTPGGSVALVLSDGRSMTLPQTISADGARYASSDGTFVFWSKGNTAFIEEGATQQQTYSNCIQVVADPGGLPQVYENGTLGFSIRYPSGYTSDASYQYTEMGPGKSINGVKFTIDPSVATGTNLASDSYISVEQIPNEQNCSANLFLDTGAPTQVSTVSTVTDNGTTYSVASSTGAGAGNRYDETVYAIPGTDPCIAIRYWIHYGVIQNYPAGSVQQFDENALDQQFDTIRRTLTIGQ
jgi:membrane-bound inhibitor of C-type lysozyme